MLSRTARAPTPKASAGTDVTGEAVRTDRTRCRRRPDHGPDAAIVARTGSLGDSPSTREDSTASLLGALVTADAAATPAPEPHGRPRRQSRHGVCDRRSGRHRRHSRAQRSPGGRRRAERRAEAAGQRIDVALRIARDAHAEVDVRIGAGPATPLGPTVPTTDASRHGAPRATPIEPSWTSVTVYPTDVSIDTVFPPVGTVPAKDTTPPTGASTGLPLGAPMSTPRCWPPA